MRFHTGRNHGLWAGPLIAVLGFASYYTIFVWADVTRNVPWAPLLIIAGGITWSGFALHRAWRRGGWRRGAGVASLLLSVAAAGILSWYCFVFSYDMPAPGAPAAVGADVPAVQAIGPDGTPVDLQAASAGTLVLIFYRGYW